MSPKESVENDRVIKLIIGGVKSLGVRGLASAVGISPAIITRYTQGKVGEPSQATLLKLAAYFKIPVEWLRGDLGGNYEDIKADIERAAKFNSKMAEYIARDDDLCKKISGLLRGLDVQRLEMAERYVSALRAEVLRENEENLKKEFEEAEHRSAELNADLEARKKKWYEDDVFEPDHGKK